MRPLPAKRVREAIIDYESDCDTEDPDTTIDESFSESLLDQSCTTRGESYWKTRCLEAEALLKAEKQARKDDNAKWEAKYEADFGPSRDLFLQRTKPSRENGSGQARYYCKSLRAIAIDAAGEGVASKDIQRVLKSVHRFIGYESEDGVRKVPEVDYFNKSRSGELGRLADKQRDRWVENANLIALSVDGTTMGGKHFIAIGGFNERTEYHCLAIKQIEAGTGIEIASTMLEMIRQIPGLEAKMRILISDRDRAQENANRRLVELLNRDRPINERIIIMVCLMHTVIRIDDRSYEKLSKEAKAVFSLLAQIFGSRKSMAHRKACLKIKLNEKLEGPSGFDTKIGSRYHVNKSNGEVLIHFEDEIREVLAMNAKHHKHHQLLEYMASPQWSKIRFELAIPVLIWVTLINDFHHTISQSTTYGQIKAAFQTAFDIVTEVLAAKNPFTVALTKALESNPTNEVTKSALDNTAKYWQKTNSNTKKEIGDIARKSFDEGRAKLESDWIIMGELEVSDDFVMQWSQRRIEASFAYLKCCARRFETMRTENIQMLARARQNHLSSWVNANLDEITDGSAEKAYYERMEKYEHDFTLEQAVESFNGAV